MKGENTFTLREGGPNKSRKRRVFSTYCQVWVNKSEQQQTERSIEHTTAAEEVEDSEIAHSCFLVVAWKKKFIQHGSSLVVSCSSICCFFLLYFDLLGLVSFPLPLVCIYIYIYINILFYFPEGFHVVRLEQHGQHGFFFYADCLHRSAVNV